MKGAHCNPDWFSCLPLPRCRAFQAAAPRRPAVAQWSLLSR